MKRFAASLTLAAVLFSSLPSAQAQDFRYVGGPYAPPSQQQDHPVLKKVLIGAGLVGVGFLVGRLTAPKPGPVYSSPPIHYGSQPHWNPSWQQGNHHHGRPAGAHFSHHRL